MVPSHVLTTYICLPKEERTIQIFHLLYVRKLKTDKNSAHDATRSTMASVQRKADTEHNRQLFARLAHARTGTA